MAPNGTTVTAEQYMHESACGLEDPNAVVNQKFVDVLEAVASKLENTEVGASGCGSCAHVPDGGLLHWVAQHDAVESMMVNFGHDQYDDQYVGAVIIREAERMGVPASWNGDDMMCVYLGDEDRYTNFDPGTRVVRKGSMPRHDKPGTVLNPDLVNPDMDYVVRSEGEKSFSRGEVVAKFNDKDEAEKHARNRFDDASVSHSFGQCTKDGDNLVQLDGQGSPTVVKGSSLEVLD